MFKRQILGMYMSLVQICFETLNTKRGRSKVIQTVTGWLFSSKNCWQNDISLKKIMYAFFSSDTGVLKNVLICGEYLIVSLQRSPLLWKKVKTTLNIYMVLTPYCKILENCYFNYHLFELLMPLKADISDSGFQKYIWIKSYNQELEWVLLC